MEWTPVFRITFCPVDLMWPPPAQAVSSNSFRTLLVLNNLLPSEFWHCCNRRILVACIRRPHRSCRTQWATCIQSSACCETTRCAPAVLECCLRWIPAFALRIHGLHECTGWELRAVVRPQNEVGQVPSFCCLEETVNCMLPPYVPGKHICQPFPCKAV